MKGSKYKGKSNALLDAPAGRQYTSTSSFPVQAVSLLPHEQFLSTVQRANRPLIVLSETPHADDVATAFGLVAALKKLNKDVDIVSSGGPAPKSLAFLEGPAVKETLPNVRSLTVHLNVGKTKVDELSYAVEGEELRILITPKNGVWTHDDVKIATSTYRYDLIIMIGVPDLPSLGKFATDYADFLFQTPIINLDHTASNEQYGHVNIVDISAVANGEACYELLSRIDAQMVDAQMATCFLTGMIAKTKSFKTPNVTPKTLKVVGALINGGAKRDEIIEKLYRTRSVETLRLWGRALARLKADTEKHIVWTMLTKDDFVHSGTNESALEDIVEELLATSPEARIVGIFYEHNGAIAVRLHAERPHDALHLGAPFKASGTREVARLIVTAPDIVAAERAVITHLKNAIAT